MKRHSYFERRASIETPRLWLRPMEADDAESVVRWRNEPSTAAMFFSEPPSLEEHRRWFAAPRRGRVDYVVVRRDNQRPIGVVNFKKIDESAGTAEAGKLLGDRRSRGKGMAKESFGAWLLYGFGSLGLRQIVVRTRADNSANIHLNRKLGFELEKRYQQEAADGTEQIFVTMTIDRMTVDRRDYFRSVDCQGYFASSVDRNKSQTGGGNGQ